VSTFDFDDALRSADAARSARASPRDTTTFSAHEANCFDDAPPIDIARSVHNTSIPSRAFGSPNEVS
jgi:hypothetical protein